MAVAFRLGRVLRLRESLRRGRQQEVAGVMSRQRGVDLQRRQAASDRARVLEAEAEAAAEMVLDPAFLRLSRQFEAALADTETSLAAAAEELDRMLVAKRAELLHDRREERKLVRLADGHRAQAALEEAWRVERELDEHTLADYRRTKQGEGHRGERAK